MSSQNGTLDPRSKRYQIESSKAAEHTGNARSIEADSEAGQQQPPPPQIPADSKGLETLSGVSTLEEPSKSPLTISETDRCDPRNVDDKLSRAERRQVRRKDHIDNKYEGTKERKSRPKGKASEKNIESHASFLKMTQDRINDVGKHSRGDGVASRSKRDISDYVDNESPARSVVNSSDEETLSERSDHTWRPSSNEAGTAEGVAVLPRLKYVEWQEFKHKYTAEKEVCAIEVLVGEARCYYQRAEDLTRMKTRRGTVAEVQSKNTDKKVDSVKELPERIRLNSLPLHEILRQIDVDGDWDIKPKVVLRPFKPFVYFERQIREVFEKLRDRWGETEKRQDESVRSTSCDADLLRPKTGAKVEEKTEQKSHGSLESIADGPSTAEGRDLSLHQRGYGSTTSVKSETIIFSDADELDNRKERSGPADESHSASITQLEGHLSSPKEDSRASGHIEPESEDWPRHDGRVRSGSPTMIKDQLEEEPEDPTDCVEALRHLRCLINFMDNELLPVIERIQSGKCQKVYFSDLWHLFKPGELMYAPLSSRVDNNVAIETVTTTKKPILNMPKERIQDVWKIVGTGSGRANLLAPKKSDTEKMRRINFFVVEATYYDFNGERFDMITFTHRMPPFEGTRDITSLEFYPLKFAPEREQLRSTWLRRGRMFKDLITPKHKYYFGKSLTCHPDGYRQQEDELPKHAENIDSQVIVDFLEGVAENPGWSPRFTYPPGMTIFFRELIEDYPLSWWGDRLHNKLEFQKAESIYKDHSIDDKIFDACTGKDELTRTQTDLAVLEGGELSEEGLMLLPNRVLGFVMKKRKFAILTIEGLRDIKPYRDGFQDLKLPGKHKTIVSSLVHNHFYNKRAELSDRETSHDSDIVRGKGKGLVVLLHGAPGVGKTSTAETIAEAYRKPLLPITCGDLGLTAKEVEAELADKFHLAELWDCVLLLDEADVFLAQRARTDVRRNSLVSVFLRVLEYFTGILFLTTNRVGAFDEAFKSRIHISLYYPPLDWNQTKAIWEMNMAKLRDKKIRRDERLIADEEQLYQFARQHYKVNRPKNTQWNGRQIRNAFQTAAALAEFEAHEATQKAKRSVGVGEESKLFESDLKVEHFETVAVASSEFDDYLYKVRGKTDSSRAFFDQERADQYQPARWPSPRIVQQPAQEYPGLSPPSFTPSGIPRTQGSSPGPSRARQHLSPQGQAYDDIHPQYTNPTMYDDALSEEGEETEHPGQSWQEMPTSFPQPTNLNENSGWQQRYSPQGQYPRNQPMASRGPHLFPPNSGPRDY